MKVGITVEERLVYTNEIIVEQPDDMTDDEFDGIIDSVAGEHDSTKDLIFKLEKHHNLEVVSYTDNFPESPERSDLEITDIYNVKNESE